LPAGRRRSQGISPTCQFCRDRPLALPYLRTWHLVLGRSGLRRYPLPWRVVPRRMTRRGLFVSRRLRRMIRRGLFVIRRPRRATCRQLFVFGRLRRMTRRRLFVIRRLRREACRALFKARRPRRDIRRRFFLSKKAFRASRPGIRALGALELSRCHPIRASGPGQRELVSPSPSERS